MQDRPRILIAVLHLSSASRLATSLVLRVSGPPGSTRVPSRLWAQAEAVKTCAAPGSLGGVRNEVDFCSRLPPSPRLSSLLPLLCQRLSSDPPPQTSLVAMKLLHLVAAAALPLLASSHFTLDYPYSRGFDEDIEPRVSIEAHSPYSTKLTDSRAQSSAAASTPPPPHAPLTPSPARHPS